MLSPRRAAFVGGLCLTLSLLGARAPRASPPGASINADASNPATPGLAIAVTDFSGKDPDLGRFIAETLLTDLAESSDLRLVERSEIRRALVELKLQSSGLAEPHQAQELGKLVSADRLVVGSYLVRDDQIIVNARLLDVHTARLVPGGASNVSGSRSDLLNLTHRLARQFHRRLTGSDLKLDVGEAADSQPEQPSETSHPELAAGPHPSSRQPTDSDELQRLKSAHLAPESVHGNDVLYESDLAGLVKRVSDRVTPQTDNPMTVLHPAAAVTRVRALSAFAKIVVPPDRIDGYRQDTPDQRLTDYSVVPAWGLPYVTAALNEGLWLADRPLRPRDVATWTFVAAVVAKMTILDDGASTTRHAAIFSEPSDPNAFTGLIIDARELGLQRTMGPRLLDEDGNVIYPDPNHVPGYDFLEEHGMAAYGQSSSDAGRSGSRPLVVRALAAAGAGNDDVVVSNGTAERIRQAERRGKFLRRWAVTIIVDAGN